MEERNADVCPSIEATRATDFLEAIGAECRMSAEGYGKKRKRK
jgi:hypothetical protein